MNKISKAHRTFAIIIKQDVLTHPENYLGPNWEEVINFWLYLDNLSYDQLRVVYDRYLTLSDEEWNRASVKTFDAAEATTRYYLSAKSSAHKSVSYANYAACRATEELIGLDKLLEQGHQPVFFPMFLDI
jgi:predicted double-glycine peptidase